MGQQTVVVGFIRNEIELNHKEGKGNICKIPALFLQSKKFDKDNGDDQVQNDK